MNRLVKKEQESRYKNNFFTDKYGKVTNNALYPCCNEETKTVDHLFATKYFLLPYMDGFRTSADIFQGVQDEIFLEIFSIIIQKYINVNRRKIYKNVIYLVNKYESMDILKRNLSKKQYKEICS
jgi:hypothetical protein